MPFPFSHFHCILLLFVCQYLLKDQRPEDEHGCHTQLQHMLYTLPSLLSSSCLHSVFAVSLCLFNSLCSSPSLVVGVYLLLALLCFIPCVLPSWILVVCVYYVIPSVLDYLISQSIIRACCTAHLLMPVPGVHLVISPFSPFSFQESPYRTYQHAPAMIFVGIPLASCTKGYLL